MRPVLQPPLHHSGTLRITEDESNEDAISSSVKIKKEVSEISKSGGIVDSCSNEIEGKNDMTVGPSTVLNHEKSSIQSCIIQPEKVPDDVLICATLYLWPPPKYDYVPCTQMLLSVVL